MYSENSKTSHCKRRLLNLTDEVILKRLINMLIYQVLASTIHGKT